MFAELVLTSKVTSTELSISFVLFRTWRTRHCVRTSYTTRPWPSPVISKRTCRKSLPLPDPVVFRRLKRRIRVALLTKLNGQAEQISLRHQIHKHLAHTLRVGFFGALRRVGQLLQPEQITKRRWGQKTCGQGSWSRQGLSLDLPGIFEFVKANVDKKKEFVSFKFF